MLREDEFADDLLAAFEVALKEYAADDEKLAYQLGSPFGPYLATRVPKVAVPAARASTAVHGARASKGGVNAVPVPASAPRAEDEESGGEDGERAEVSGRAKRVAKPPPAPPKHCSETRAPEEKKRSRSGPSGMSGARKAARAAAEVAAAAAAAAGHTPPPPPGPRAMETALRTENGELKVQLAKVNEECSSLKGQLAALKATVELREQLAVATAKAACGGLMLRAMTNLGGGARAGSSGVQTPGGEDTPTGSSISQQLAFDAFFGSR